MPRKRSWGKLSIANTVIILFAFCVLLPVMLTSDLFIANLQRDSARQRDQLVAQLNGQISNALDLISEEIEGLGKLHTSRWDILRILRREYAAHDGAYVSDCRLMADLIGVCMQTNEKLYRMTFVSRSGEVFTQFSPPYLDDMQAMLARIERLKSDGGNRMIFAPAKAMGISGESLYIPYILRLRDPHTWIPVGYLAVDLKYSAIENLLDAGEAVPGGAHVMILVGEGETADGIILCLSSMLRYSSRPSTFVVIREEIEQVRNYLTIQMLRFPDTIRTRIDVEPELYDCRIIKFMLQPLVENAFKHGLEMIKRNRELILTVCRKGEDARISISDNGMGIPPEKLEALRRELARISNGDAGSAAEARSLGIGLINVHKRLYYTYGSRYGITLESEYGAGTVVVMTMPVRIKEEDSDADSGC